MAEHPASHDALGDDVAAKAVMAICDRYLSRVGLPTYTNLADARIEETQHAAAGLHSDAARHMESELRRLRVAHGIVASEVRSALLALERQDIFAVDNLLTEAAGTASLHARPHHQPAIYPPNVIPLGPARIARRARALGGL